MNGALRVNFRAKEIAEGPLEVNPSDIVIS